MTGDTQRASSGFPHSVVAMPTPLIEQGPENRHSHGSPFLGGEGGERGLECPSTPANEFHPALL